MQRKFIWTNEGLARLINLAPNETLTISQYAVGDGNGVIPTPDKTQTALINEVHRANINNIQQDILDKKKYRIEIIIPKEVGGFNIREVGLYASDGVLIGVADHSEYYKPLPEEMIETKKIVLNAESINADQINVFFSNDAVIATNDSVNAAIEENKYIHPENHPASIITEDETHRFVTDTEKNNWNNKAEVSYVDNLPFFTNDPSNMPTIANNLADAEHDINITTGFCYDLTTKKLIKLLCALTKRADATFVEGNDQGGMVSGESLPVSGTIHIWLISKADGTADVCFNNYAISGLNPVLPTGFVNKRRIASLKTDASANIIAFIQKANTGKFIYDSLATPADFIGNSSTTPTPLTINVPSGIEVEAIIKGQLTLNNSGDVLNFYKTGTSGIQAVVGEGGTETNGANVGTVYVTTNSSSQITYATLNYARAIGITTLGYIEERLS